MFLISLTAVLAIKNSHVERIYLPSWLKEESVSRAEVFKASRAHN